MQLLFNQIMSTLPHLWFRSSRHQQEKILSNNFKFIDLKNYHKNLKISQKETKKLFLNENI